MVPGAPKLAIDALAIHAARDIEAGEELTLYYGNEYVRDYGDAGRPAEKHLSLTEIRAMGEIPAKWLHSMPYVDGDVWVER